MPCHCPNCNCQVLDCYCKQPCVKPDIGSSPFLPAISPRTCRLLSTTSGVNSNKEKAPATDTGNLSPTLVKSEAYLTSNRSLATLATLKPAGAKRQRRTYGRKKLQLKAQDSNLGPDPFSAHELKTGNESGNSLLEEQCKRSLLKLDSLTTSTSPKSLEITSGQNPAKRKYTSIGAPLVRGRPARLGRRLEKALSQRTPIPSGGAAIVGKKILLWTNSAEKSTLAICYDGWIGIPSSSRSKEDIELLARREYGSPAISTHPIGTPTSMLTPNKLFDGDSPLSPTLED